MALKYKRIVLKLSGESLMGDQLYGISPVMLQYYARQIKGAVDLGVQVAVVIGGGNIYRGLQAAESGIERVQGDYMGMMATVINGMAIQSALEKIDEPYIRRKAHSHLKKGRVVIFSAGTGSPYFTTDSAAALRANEINADVLLKGTRVDGIYNADPEKDPNAKKYDRVSFKKVLEFGLNVMDTTAFTMCQENDMPIIVFDINNEENLLRILKGEQIGTVVERL
jgi:uridylate kinase